MNLKKLSDSNVFTLYVKELLVIRLISYFFYN